MKKLFKTSAALVLCLSAVILISCKRDPELTRFYPLPDFSLTDQTDTTVTLADLKGKVWVADFIFTNCAGTCPMMTGEMKKLHAALPAEIRMVSFTVDPARDTPKALAAYAAEHGANRDRWLFLTGSREALYELCVKGFKLPVDDTSGTAVEPITHSSRFVLVDRQGEVRGYYSGTEQEDLERLAADAKKLL
jgi:protein SCO1/2